MKYLNFWAYDRVRERTEYWVPNQHLHQFACGCTYYKQILIIIQYCLLTIDAWGSSFSSDPEIVFCLVIIICEEAHLHEAADFATVSRS